MENASLAAILRRAIEAMLARDQDADTIDRATTQAQALAETLECGPERTMDNRIARFGEQMIGGTPADGALFSPFAESPITGRRNPLSPLEVEIRRQDAGVAATVVLGVAMQGAPARAHGGVVSALFDDLMGANQRVINRHGYTRSLTINYRRPFPLEVPVEFVVAEIPANPGRFAMEATASANGQVVATATGIFTDIAPEEFIK